MKLLDVTWCYLLFMLINHRSSHSFVSAKSLETQNLASCRGHVGDFFQSFLNVTIEPSNKVGKCPTTRIIASMSVICYKHLCVS
jgi:hypothetical protein